MKKAVSLLIIIAGIVLAGCSPSPLIYYDTPVELKIPQKKSEFIKKYSQFIRGKVFYLDPGHGGDDRKNKGYQSLAIEADVNLKVALYLKEFLSNAGSMVHMSRDKDITVSLKDRSILANQSGADLFISIHHNASPTEGDDWTEYTSTYYHATPSDYEYEPSEHNIAKFVQRDLAYAVRNSGGLGSFDGTYSDYALYPGDGLSVLRETKIPAILVECSFHTHKIGEQLLTIEEFNEIEAWGIFRGLCRYFEAGIPQINYLDDNKILSGDKLELQFILEDKSGIDNSSIKVYYDKFQHYAYSYDNFNKLLKLNIKNVKPGEHIIRIVAANNNGNYAFPFHKKIIVNQ